MSTFTTTVSSSNCETAEEAVAALKTLADALDATQKNLAFGIIPIEGKRYLAWTASTAGE